MHDHLADGAGPDRHDRQSGGHRLEHGVRRGVDRGGEDEDRARPQQRPQPVLTLAEVGDHRDVAPGPDRLGRDENQLAPLRQVGLMHLAQELAALADHLAPHENELRQAVARCHAGRDHRVESRSGDAGRDRPQLALRQRVIGAQRLGRLLAVGYHVPGGMMDSALEELRERQRERRGSRGVAIGQPVRVAGVRRVEADDGRNPPHRPDAAHAGVVGVDVERVELAQSTTQAPSHRGAERQLRP